MGNSQQQQPKSMFFGGDSRYPETTMSNVDDFANYQQGDQNQVYESERRDYFEKMKGEIQEQMKHNKGQAIEKEYQDENGNTVREFHYKGKTENGVQMPGDVDIQIRQDGPGFVYSKSWTSSSSNSGGKGNEDFQGQNGQGGYTGPIGWLKSKFGGNEQNQQQMGQNQQISPEQMQQWQQQQMQQQRMWQERQRQIQQQRQQMQQQMQQQRGFMQDPFMDSPFFEIDIQDPFGMFDEFFGHQGPFQQSPFQQRQQPQQQPQQWQQIQQYPPQYQQPQQPLQPQQYYQMPPNQPMQPVPPMQPVQPQIKDPPVPVVIQSYDKDGNKITQEKPPDDLMSRNDFYQQRYEDMPRRTQIFNDPRKQYEHDLDQIWKYYNKGCEGFNEGQPATEEFKQQLKEEFPEDKEYQKAKTVKLNPIEQFAFFDDENEYDVQEL